jgi:hypothetical protein
MINVDSNISNENTQINNKLNFDEFSKKSVNIILNSRIKNFNANNIFSSSSTQTTLNDSLNFSLEDSFLEDYSFLNNSNYQVYILEIYYHSKYVSTLIEKWTFSFDSSEFIEQSYILPLKFMTLLRSIYVLVKNLPTFFIFKNNKNNNFELNYRLLSRISYQKNFDSKFEIINKELNNCLLLEYISEKDIKKLKNNDFLEQLKKNNNKLNLYKKSFEKDKKNIIRKLSSQSNNLSNVLNDSKLSNDDSFEFEILDDENF